MILLHLNGPSAVGKTTIAERIVEARPGAMWLDIDAIRVSMPGWLDDPGSKQRARDIGFAAAVEHLRAGHDVVLPQLVMRIDVIAQLQQLSSSVGAVFVEVMLTAERDELVRRFHARRDAKVGDHPSDEVVDVEAMTDHVVRDVEHVLAAWPTAIVIESTTPAETAARVLAALPTT